MDYLQYILLSITVSGAPCKHDAPCWKQVAAISTTRVVISTTNRPTAIVAITIPNLGTEAIRGTTTPAICHIVTAGFCATYYTVTDSVR